MKKILWLASWYPNRVDPLNGDFIERHARAAATCNDIFLIHVQKDRNQLPSKETEYKNYPEKLTAQIIYYKSRRSGIRWVDALFSNYAFLSAYIQSINSYRKINGNPHCIHVHIALKAGLVALWYKWIHGIPYIVSEQWTGLCPEARPNIDDRSYLFRRLWKLVMQQAVSFTAVSSYLANQIRDRFSIAGGTVIPNVVDTKIFYPAAQKTLPFHFIHISTLKFQKNPEAMLEAAAILKAKGVAFKFSMVGQPTEALQKLTTQLGLEKEIDFKGVMFHPELAAFMRTAHALILYSRFETFGCVLIEANASGIPVIVSDIPVLHENVEAGVNGVFVPLGYPGKLAETMLAVLQHEIPFDPDQIVARVNARYTFERVGLQFDELYKQG